MTQEEADKIAYVIRTADNGCDVCVRKLCERLTAENLGFVFRMTHNDVVEIGPQPDWSDDPDDRDEKTWPEVVAEMTDEPEWWEASDHWGEEP